jgi:hypothetical protein
MSELYTPLCNIKPVYDLGPYGFHSKDYSQRLNNSQDESKNEFRLPKEYEHRKPNYIKLTHADV